MKKTETLLSEAEAAKYLAPFASFKTVGKRIGMDVDPQVLTYGHGGKGAILVPGCAAKSIELHDKRGSTFIDGDVVIDDWAENDGGLVFVRGNVTARSLYTSGYFIIGGDLRVERFFGSDEQYGTYVFGNASIKSAVFVHNHHFDVWKRCTIEDEVHDEEHGRAAARKRLHQWGVLDDPENVDYMMEVQPKLRAWAESPR